MHGKESLTIAGPECQMPVVDDGDVATSETEESKRIQVATSQWERKTPVVQGSDGETESEHCICDISEKLISSYHPEGFG